MSLFAPVTGWFLSRTPRERWLIILMLAVALPLLAWLAVARPLMLSLDAAEARHVAAVQGRGEVLAQLAQLERSPAPTIATTEAPLALRVTDAAAQAGIRLASNEPRGADSVTVTIAPGPPTAGLRWLRQLEANGISVRELTITPDGAGTVSVRATLGTGAAS